MPGLRRKDAARFVVMDSVCVCVKQGASTFPHSFEPAGYVLIGPALDGDLIGDKEKGPPEGRPFVLIAA